MDQTEKEVTKRRRWKLFIATFVVVASAGLILAFYILYYRVPQVRYLITTYSNYVLVALGVVASLVLITVLIRVGYRYDWTGLGEYTYKKTEGQEVRPKKTVWDWLQLLIVPLALAAVGFFFTMQQDARQQELENQRAQNTVLQAYLDQMTQLLIERNLRGADLGGKLAVVARAQTLTALAILDEERSATVLQFLYEADLIGKEHVVVNLSGANFDHAALPDELSGSVLKETSLRWADLSFCDLRDADLSRTLLVETDLSYAELQSADLSNTILWDADLSYANLKNAGLKGADLEGADLEGAEGITNEQLEQQAASLKGATLPNGSKHP